MPAKILEGLVGLGRWRQSRSRYVHSLAEYLAAGVCGEKREMPFGGVVQDILMRWWTGRHSFAESSVEQTTQLC